MDWNALKEKMPRPNTCGRVAASAVLIATGVIVGYAVGTAVMWALSLVFGAKVAAVIYMALWIVTGAWLWLTVFNKDKYGYRA